MKSLYERVIESISTRSDAAKQEGLDVSGQKPKSKEQEAPVSYKIGD